MEASALSAGPGVRIYALVVMTMTAAIQQMPPDHRGGCDLARAELSATGPTYDDARAELQGRVPEGWRVLHVRVDHD